MSGTQDLRPCPSPTLAQVVVVCQCLACFWESLFFDGKRDGFLHGVLILDENPNSGHAAALALRGLRWLGAGARHGVVL